MTQVISETVFRKHYSSVTVAQESYRRTQVLRNTGFTTPAAHYQSGSLSIDFDFVKGSSGVGLLETTELVMLIEPLALMQQQHVNGLIRFDPFLRIDPRLQQLDIPGTFFEPVERLRGRTFAAVGTVHGDFHFGQLIKDEAGKVWLLDLDDLALGPSEVDLGNVIAHLSTHPATAANELWVSVKNWEHRILDAWATGDRKIDLPLLRYFTQVAVIRRALKRLQAGSGDLIDQCLEPSGFLSLSTTG